MLGASVTARNANAVAKNKKENYEYVDLTKNIAGAHNRLRFRINSITGLVQTRRKSESKGQPKKRDQGKQWPSSGRTAFWFRALHGENRRASVRLAKKER